MYDKLRALAAENRASYGISSELAKVKQETTKGLWTQVTSQLTESFTGGYEILEPVIRDALRSFLVKFKAPEFTKEYLYGCALHVAACGYCFR
ncbi:hypothetical protein [Parabacteroides pacaensis]|uniref:hypothetical protein n=1 Tax=Parabacteroides pacaensis TaxID=2086575 RepID=UPI000D0FFFDC|nr:hypothetical protein [Parabacteroides pacaensis]